MCVLARQKRVMFSKGRKEAQVEDSKTSSYRCLRTDIGCFNGRMMITLLRCVYRQLDSEGMDLFSEVQI